jgi:alanine racemase
MTHNLNVYRRALQPSVKMMAMVKAAGYGSGEAETGKLLEHHGIDYLGVAYADEGIALRKSGVGAPIMVLNPAPDEFDAMYRYQLEPEIYAQDILGALVHYTGTAKRMRIHIKLDTGMHRLGFEQAELDDLIQLVLAYPNLEIASIFSHLAAADKPQFDDFTRKQVSLFLEMYYIISSAIGYKPMRHVANSGAITRFPEYQFDMVRLGIGLYGAEGVGLSEPLQVVHTLKARISQIKDVAAGETVGYNRNGPVLKDARIATINIGYADGLLRAAGNGRYQLNIGKYKAPTIGNICMDMCMVDVSQIPDIAVGDEVIIFGEDPSVEDLAKVYQTISYEVFTGVSSRVKRVYWME